MTTTLPTTTLSASAAAKLRCSHTHRCTAPVVIVLVYQFGGEGTRKNHYPLCAEHGAEYSRDTAVAQRVLATN